MKKTPETSGAFEADDIVLISDCRKGDMFRVTGVSQSGGPTAPITLAHASSGNTTPLLTNTYDSAAEIMKMATRAYFVGVNPVVSPEPSLYRLSLDNNDWTPEPLVEGIEQIKVLMGVDTTTATTSRLYGY